MKETGDPREYEAFVREIDDSRYAIDKDMVPRGVIPKRRGMSLSKSLAMEGVFPFPDFAPRLLASLVASSTASCTSGVVTVSATAHGIPATTFDGYTVYYPGSPSLAAGWYVSFARTSADAITFSAPGVADFSIESVNSGAAFTSEVTYESLTLPASTLVVGSKISVPTYRASNNVASTKTTRLKIGSSTVITNAITATTGMCGVFDMIAVVDSTTSCLGYSVSSGVTGSSVNKQAVDVSTDLTASVTGQISVAGQYIAMVCPALEIR